MQQWAVQVGLAVRGRAEMGLVLHFAQSKAYIAERGRGCFVIDLKNQSSTKLSTWDLELNLLDNVTIL